MDNEINIEFELKLTPRDDKAVCNQILAKPMHLKGNLIVKLDLMREYG